MATVKAVWQFACEDEVRSSPTVHNGILYVGAYDHNLYALDAESGKFLWKYATEGGIASSPAVAEDRVFFGSIDQVLYAVHAVTGRLMWTCPTKGRIYSSPRVQFGHVFIGSDDHRLYAVNTLTGRVAWSFESEGAIRSTPAVTAEAMYFGDESGTLNALDFSRETPLAFPGPARHYFVSRCCQRPAVRRALLGWFVYACRPSAGWVVWRFFTDGWATWFPPRPSTAKLSTSGLPTGTSTRWTPRKAVSSGSSGPEDRSRRLLPSTAARFYVGSVDGGVLLHRRPDGPVALALPNPGGPVVEAAMRRRRPDLRRLAGPASCALWPP